MHRTLEEKAASVRQDLDLEFQKWAKIFSPIENPNRDGSLVFTKSETDFLDKQDPNCIWTIHADLYQGDTEYLMCSRRYWDAHNPYGELGYLVTQVPYSLGDPFFDEYGGGYMIGNLVTCVVCRNDEPDCHFCFGQPAIFISMVGPIGERNAD